MNSLCVSWINDGFITYLAISLIDFANSLWEHYFLPTLFFCQLPLDSLAISRIHHGSIIFFANKLWIHVLFREYTMNALFVPRIHYNFTTFFGIKLCLHYLFREYIKKSWFVWRSHHKSTICLTFLILSIYLQIHYELI